MRYVRYYRGGEPEPMITVQANPKDLERILRKLQGLGKEAPKAIRTAVNDTAVSARKLLAQQAQQQYTVKNGGFNKHAKIKKAMAYHRHELVAPLSEPEQLRQLVELQLQWQRQQQQLHEHLWHPPRSDRNDPTE